MSNTVIARFVVMAVLVICGAVNAATIGTLALDPASASVPRYSKLEIVVPLNLPAGAKPFETDPAAGGVDLGADFLSPTGKQIAINGFFDGTQWKIRFAPGEIGAWSFTVRVADSTGSATSASTAFTCTASNFPGFLQINGKYLRFSDGSVFFGVGHNNGWQYDPEVIPFSDMASRGENLFSFWMGIPWAKPSYASTAEPFWNYRSAIENLESGIGNYHQPTCEYLDGLIARAEAAGIYLIPSIWIHAQLRQGTVPPFADGNWDNNPYSTICAAADFFKRLDLGAETAQWKYQKNFLRYIIARWGHSRAIASWVGVVEIDGTNGASNPAQLEDWCAAMRNHMAAQDKYRVNDAGAYPLAISKVDVTAESSIWNSGCDMRGVDSYSKQGDNTGIATAIATQTQAMRATGTPAFHSEFGGDTTRGALQPVHLHNAIWAGTSAGAALAPIVWCDGGSFPLLSSSSGATMRDHLQYLAQFMAQVDFLGNANLASAQIGVTAPCRGWGMQLGDRGFGWIQNPTGTMGSQVLTISGVDVGSYRILWYDGWSSGVSPVHVSDMLTVFSDQTLMVEIPTLARGDIAFRFVPETESSFTSGSSIDTDKDGFPDELELTVGSSPVNFNSTPLSAPPGPAEVLPAPKLSIKLNFSKLDSDGISLSGTATVAAEFAPLDQTLIVDVGGLVRSFTLDAKGSGGDKTNKFKLSAKAGSAKYSMKLSKTSVAASFSDEGLTNSDAKSHPVTVPVFVLLSQKLYKADLQQLYTARAGKSGRTTAKKK